jgi:eukaryotic-like serine/threonine-protein kinase
MFPPVATHGAMRIKIDNARWQQLSPHLDRALEMSNGERERWLEHMRASDPALADDLGVLLRSHSAVAEEGFLADVAQWAQRDVTLAGMTVGAYTLDAAIGQGGMGSVWRAHRSDGRFEGVAAVKLLNLALIGRRGVERFRREASVLARLQHPNIARLLDAGITQLGQPYLVLEYVHGECIDDYCDKRALSVDARLRLFVEVLAAVEHAHASLIVHCDIKPSNLLVTGDGAVKLLDFGIAKLLADPPDRPADLTRKDTRVLTPEFAAPEQFASSTVTTATDVYALGVLLYVLLSGCHPAGPDVQHARERLHAIVDEAPPVSDCAMSGADQEALTERARRRCATPEKLRRQLAGDLDNIAAKALKLDPRERYESAARLAADIHRHLNDEVVSARADTLAYRIGKFVRRHRLGVAMTAFTGCALVAAITLTTWQMLEASAQRDEALYQTRRAQAVNDFMNAMMAQVAPNGRALTPLELLDQGRTLLDKQYGGDPAFVAGILVSIAGRYADLGRIDKELETLEQSERIARALHDDELLANVQCNTVDTEVRLGQRERATVRMEEGRKALERVKNARIGLKVSCLYAEVYLAQSQGDVDAAIGYARRALALLERNRVENLEYTMITSELSGLYAQKGLLKESAEYNLRTREMFDRTGRGSTMGRLITVHNEAFHLAKFGEIKAAEVLQRSVIERMQARDAGAAMPPEMASQYGVILSALAKPDDALAWLRFAVYRAHADGNTVVEARSKLQLSRALMRTSNTADAEPLLDEALATLRRDAGDKRVELFDAAHAHAELRLLQNRIDDARREIDSLLATLGYPKSAASLFVEQPLLTATHARLRAGDATAAVSFAEAALAAAQSVARDPTQSANVGRALALLAEARYAKGDIPGARDAFQRARLPLANGLGADHPLAREVAASLARLD